MIINVDPFAPKIILRWSPVEVLGELGIVGSLIISKKDEKAKYKDIIKVVQNVLTAEYGLNVASVLSNNKEEILLQL